MTFTDAHSGSSVCTPTRYGILTGRYAWRSRLKKGCSAVIPRFDRASGRLTVASLLHQQGYQTACIGKWHLGLGWGTSRPLAFGDEIDPKERMAAVDYTQPIARGDPSRSGSTGITGSSASLDMPPYLYIKDDRTVGVPTTERTYIRKGPAHADFEAVGVLPTLADQAVAFLDDVQ